MQASTRPGAAAVTATRPGGAPEAGPLPPGPRPSLQALFGRPAAGNDGDTGGAIGGGEDLHAVAAPGTEGTAFVEQLGSFEEVAAAGPAGPVPSDVSERFEAAHGVSLASVRVHVVDTLAQHGLRGLSRGRQIVVADASDRDAIEHELGHVVDTIGLGGAPANTSLDGMPLADDPAREARADQLAEQARVAVPGKPRAEPTAAPREPSAAPAGAAQPKLTSRTAIARVGGQFSWAPHKTAVAPTLGGGFTSQGLGAVLATTTKLSYTGDALNKQLRALDMTVPPECVDDTRPPLPDAPLHPSGHKGIYVVPSALLGAAIDANLLYLPPAALGELALIQGRMIAFAKAGPVRVRANTAFGKDGLADRVQLVCEALDRVTGAPGASLAWDTPIEADRDKWGAAAAAKGTQTGFAPLSAEWRTQITWDKPYPNGDGRRVVADKLGPDHPLGSAPTDATADRRVKLLESASTPKSGKAEPYIAGHLLNDHLGGPGNVSANLAPIPRKANSQMSESIEKPAKKIVNEERGWIRYEVVVTEAHDAASKLDYPSRVAAEIEVYDHAGNKQGKNRAIIDIDAPSDYAKKQATDPTADRKLTGAAIQTSPVMLDEVILSHENDLRPNLRDGAELFKLLVGSDIHANVDNPDFPQAWHDILEALHAFELAALPDLNLISTVSTALTTRRTDPVARRFLEDTKVGAVQQALDSSFNFATAFVVKATRLLQRANAVVRKEIVPSDLFRNTDLLRFADKLVESAPKQVSMLSLLESMESATVPLRVSQQQNAKTSGDLLGEAEQTKLLSDYGSQPHASAPSFQLSPVRAFEQSQTSVHTLESRAFYGADFVSERAPKVVEVLCAIGIKQDYSAVQRLLADPVLTKSDRCRTLLEQLKQPIIDLMWNPQAIDMKEFAARHKITWTDSIEMLGRKEPEVALQLYKMVGL